MQRRARSLAVGSVLHVADCAAYGTEGVVSLCPVLRADALGTVGGLDTDEGASDVRHDLAPQSHCSLLTSTRVPL
jgi:hypothetical protein